jgi:hypothetical protein
MKTSIPHVINAYEKTAETDVPPFEKRISLEGMESDGTEKLVADFRAWVTEHVKSIAGEERKKLVLLLRASVAEVTESFPGLVISEETERQYQRAAFAITHEHDGIGLRRMKPVTRVVLRFFLEQSKTPDRFYSLEEVAQAVGYQPSGVRTAVNDLENLLLELGQWWKLQTVLEGKTRKWQVACVSPYTPVKLNRYGQEQWDDLLEHEAEEDAKN